MQKTFRLPAIPYRYRVLVFLTSLTTLTYLDRVCISIVGVRIKSELGLSNEQFGWVLASFALAYALFEIPSGAWGDKIGPRAVFIRIVFWWSLFTALTGMVNGLAMLLIIRFLFGAGESGTYPNCMIVMSRWFPSQEMARSLTWVGIGSQIGAAIAPLIIVPIAIHYGWRVPFFVLALIGIIWVMICYAWFRNFPHEMKKISAEELDRIEKNRRYDNQSTTISWKTILSHRVVWALMVMYFCCQWANYFFVAWLPVYLQEGRGFSENQMKWITSAVFITGIIGFVAGGFAGDLAVKAKGLKFGRRFIGMTGLGMASILVFFAAFLDNRDIAAYCLVGANGFFSYGIMVSYAVCIDVGRNNAGTVTGAMNFSGQMGAFFLAIVFGKIVDSTHHFNYPLFTVTAVLCFGSLLWLLIDPTKKIGLKNAED